ncbi:MULTISPECIES: hypothetical protein [unclassified Chromohalobacter]|uniref:hypothetical protein n=1 Tax=unclassified Chromohalobacter TaxID=2628571 RepID=UPI00246902D4|nr:MULTISPECIES: hypothetical protein [unclassified Chromohalobacter]
MQYAKYGRVALAIITVGIPLLSTMASASSEEAWSDFRANVEKTCRAAAADSFNVETIAVDPFGSKHFGLARLTGHERGTKKRLQILCAYDKQTQQAEIGGPMDIKTDMQAGKRQ